jgi:NADPH-dependent 2,4-dienoyl-CoA reductase/sulfur reductase-like enzyme
MGLPGAKRGGSPLQVVILGNGITGITAAVRLRALHPDWGITIVSGESTYHYSRPALMYVFMGHMRYKETKPYPDSFWSERGLELVRAWVEKVDTEAKVLECSCGTKIPYDRLLLATGALSNKFGWPGQDLEGVQGLYNLMDLRLLAANAERARHAVLVGGGLIGVELAEMLKTRGIGVTFLVRETSYWNNILPPEESGMITKMLREEGIDLRLETELGEILDDGKGRCRGVLTKGGEEIACEIVGLTAGVSPNLSALRESGIPCGRGVLVDDQLKTQIPDVYAAGDCAEIVTEGEGRNLLQQVWYTGKAQGELVAHSLAGEDVQYIPRIWFNSAKFFDLEYQVYGSVPPQKGDENQHFWLDLDGKKSLRIVEKDGRVLGIQVMGMRLRHLVCEAWLEEGRSMEYVLSHLFEADFDPEFFSRSLIKELQA